MVIIQRGQARVDPGGALTAVFAVSLKFVYERGRFVGEAFPRALEERTDVARRQPLATDNG